MSSAGSSAGEQLDAVIIGVGGTWYWNRYLGPSIAGFPNLLTVNGPCNPAVLTNVPAPIEHDVEWIADCIEYAEQRAITAGFQMTTSRGA